MPGRLGFTIVIAVLVATLTNAAEAQPDPTPEATSELNKIYFLVTDEGINYASVSPSDAPCYYGISGNVIDLYGVPYIDFVANLKMRTAESLLSDQEDEYGYPGTDTGLYRSDPSGWHIWFLGQPGDYELWLTTDIGGEELSPRVLISITDCSHRFVTVNFVQIQALPGQKPSDIPLVVTATSLGTGGRFVVENNEISYSYIPTLGMPCYYEMVGRVLDKHGKPFIDFVVNIQMIDVDGLAPSSSGYAFPGEGGFAEDGASGWSSLLPSWSGDYEVWLTTEVGGEELSPHIIVETGDCIHNMMHINFVEVG